MTSLNSQFKPEYIPFRCPICKGRGLVNWGKETCKQCGGTGILKVPPKEEEEGEEGNGNS